MASGAHPRQVFEFKRSLRSPRRRDTSDERVVRVTLTEKGRLFRDEARKFPLAMLCASGLDVRGLGALRDQLKEVSAGLREVARGT